MSYETNISAVAATTALVVGLAIAPITAQAPLQLTLRGDRPLASFDPHLDWGAALDGHDLSETATTYTPHNIAAMLSAGFGPITYRLRTELGIETWHWNPAGHFSDAAHQQGYWISNAESAAPIDLSFGYKLPRRGRTIDDANNDGYSRIDDGDTTTFWKTNPYLDPRYTGDPENRHPQWLTLDLGTIGPVREIDLAWGAPFPRHYTVAYWQGDQSLPIDDNPNGRWQTFPRGTVATGHGGTVQLVLGDTALPVRFIRIVMTSSSHTAAGGNGDARDSLGFALREIYAGTRDAAGVFHDRVQHDSVASTQSAILVSSTDPWHRATDRDEGTAQPGLDLILRSGLTNHQPMLVPTGVMYDTPENAANELRFLRSRGYPLLGVELGEEPDGQRVTPEDYGSLYLQFATALHRVDPTVRLGGPSWQDLLDDPLQLWPRQPVAGPRPTWIGRFLDYVDEHRRIADFNFLSFEWYPFDDVCSDPRKNLAAAPGMLTRELDELRAAGLPDSIPRYLTEYGYSAHLSNAEVTIPAALFDVDLVPNFFAHRGTHSFFFGYEPGALDHEPSCPHWGNLVMLLADSTGAASYRLPRYYAAWLLTHAWADSLGGTHTMVAVDRDASQPDDSLISSYAVRRPDNRWALVLVNRDPVRSRRVNVQLRPTGAAARPLRGPVDIWRYSGEQYQFLEDRQNGHPTRDLPPAHETGGTAAETTLPPYSITVLVGS
ncbi:MAG TPA: discoidin domain-containing protein [Gemmatimonadales bacterium]|jgi:hypothetical protein